MTVVLLVISHALVGAVCLLVGRRQRFGEGVERGRWLTETAHGWPAQPLPGAHKRRLWARLNRKADDPPGLVTTSFTDADRARR